MANLFIRKVLGCVLGLSASPAVMAGSPQMGHFQQLNAGFGYQDQPQEPSEPDLTAPSPPKATPGTRLSFKLAASQGGKPMSMTATSWDKNVLVGSLGDISWKAIDPRDVWRIYPRLMDTRRVETWLELGGILLYAKDDRWAQDRAQQAFDRAVSLDPTVADQVDQIKKATAEQLAAEAEEQSLRKAHSVRRSSPELGPWPDGLWPPRTTDEQAAHNIEAAGLLKSLLEDRPDHWQYDPATTFLIAHSGLDSTDLSKIADALDAHLKRLKRYVPQEGYLVGSDHFFGPVSVIISESSDEFRLLEVDLFRQITDPDALGITHYKEAMVFLHVSHNEDPDARIDALQRSLTLGYLHRHISPDRLPAWVQEGLGPAIVRLDGVELPIQSSAHDRGVQALRSGASVRPTFNLDYDSEDWPGAEDIGPTFGYLTLVVLYELYPEQTVQWIRAMKFGVPWVKALQETVGLTPDQLASLVNKYWQLND